MSLYSSHEVRAVRRIGAFLLLKIKVMDFCLKGIDNEGNEIEFTYVNDNTYLISILNGHGSTYFTMDLEDVKSLMQFLKFTNNAGLD